MLNLNKIVMTSYFHNDTSISPHFI